MVDIRRQLNWSWMPRLNIISVIVFLDKITMQVVQKQPELIAKSLIQKELIFITKSLVEGKLTFREYSYSFTL